MTKRATTAGDGELRFDFDKNRPTVGKLPSETTFHRRKKLSKEERAVHQGHKTIMFKPPRNGSRKQSYPRQNWADTFA